MYEAVVSNYPPALRDGLCTASRAEHTICPNNNGFVGGRKFCVCANGFNERQPMCDKRPMGMKQGGTNIRRV